MPAQETNLVRWCLITVRLSMPWSSSMRRCLVATCLFAAISLLPPTGSTAEPAKPVLNQAVRTFLDTYCISCHGPETKKGGLNLEALSADFKDPAAFEKW